MKAARCALIGSILVALGLFGWSCSKKTEEAKQEPGAAAAVSAPASTPSKPVESGPFAGFDVGAIKNRLQGAWVVGGTALGAKEVWDLKGSDLTVFNGKEEKKFKLDLVAPCRAYRSRTEGDTTTGEYTTFAFDGDQLYCGLGYGGVKQGDSIAACVSSDVYTFRGGKCTRWEKDMFSDKLKPADAQCSLAGDVFKVKDSTGYENELKVKGNVLLNTQMEGNLALKASDFADAKAKLAAK